MLTVEIEQLDRWRAELADYPEMTRSLNEIEDCDGDVEDAAINLAPHAGLLPDNSSDQWLVSYTKRYRVAICQWAGQWASQTEKPPEVSRIVRHLSENSPCPALLVLPVAVTAWQQGVEAFCEPLKLKIEEIL